jgi:hypothetical protein
MFIRIFLLSILSITSFYSVYGLPGYCVQAEITLKSGAVYAGYYSIVAEVLAISKDENGYYYAIREDTMHLKSHGDLNYAIDIDATDFHFANALRPFFHDTVYFFHSIAVMFNPQENNPSSPGLLLSYLGPFRRIARQDIANLKIQRVYIADDLETVVTILTPKDLEWVSGKKVIGTSDVGDSGLCWYEALFFSENKEKVKSLLKTLKELYDSEGSLDFKGDAAGREAAYRKLTIKTAEIIEKLRKEKVIVLRSCSPC